jgi:OmpA-OmpF porin, OOP family
MQARNTILLLLLSSSLFSQKLEQLGSSINTEYNELNPVVSPDSKTLYFVRVSHPSNNFGAKGSQDIWYSELRDDGIWTIARRMPNTVNKDQYNDLFSITPDGNTILVSGAYVNGRRDPDEVGLSMCKRTKTGWSEPVKLDIPKLSEMCKGQFLTASLANDGKTLIMAFSEKKNSKEDDLYISILSKDGKWSKPEPLTAINTSNTETTPFIASDNKTLYFSSDRKDGLGGTDIWRAKRSGRGWDKWDKPVNLGNVYNSDANEYSFTMSASGEYAYMTTKKNSVGKGDIVRFNLKKEEKVEVTPSGTQTNSATDPVTAETDKNKKDKKDEGGIPPIEPVTMIKGKIIDRNGRPVEAKIITQTLPDGEEFAVATSNPVTGEYQLILPRGVKYLIRVEGKDLISSSQNIDLTSQTEYKEVTGQDFTAINIANGIDIPLNNLFFKFGKSFIEEESYPELDRMIEYMNEYPSMVVEIKGHTDNIGTIEANQKLSQDRADAVKNYLVSKKIGIARVSSKGYGETKPIASNDTEEGRGKNRRVEFAIISVKK